jgi:hypothetical protein
LAGLRFDKVFTCTPCALAIVIDGGEKTRMGLEFAKIPDDTCDSPIYLPYWRLKCEIEAVPVNSDQEDVVLALKDLDTVWVGAFAMSRTNLHGDPGLELTQKKALVESESKTPSLEVVGATKSPGEATKYAQLFVTMMIDKRADVTGMEIEVKVSQAALWAMPHTVSMETEKLISMHSGFAFPLFAVTDLPEIRGANG